VDRAAKTKQVESIKGMLEPAKSVVIVHYKGMSVTEITDLRKKARRRRWLQSHQEPTDQDCCRRHEIRASEPD